MVPHELLTLYLMAAEGASVSSGSQSGARKRFSFEQYEHNVASLAPYIIGQNWSGEKILFLEDWELARVALSCHIALDLLSLKNA